MRKLILTYSILLIFFSIPVMQSDAVAQSSFTSTQAKGRISGQVIDLRGDPVASVSIIFSGEEASIKAVADEQGKYEIEIPAGVYRVSATISGFSEFRRAPFKVQPGTAKMLNIVPAFGGFTCILDMTGRDRDPDKEGIGPPQYEKLSLTQSTVSEELAVRFQLKREQSGVSEYRGGLINPTVMVSYDLIAIYAEKVRVDKNRGIVEAEGRVTVEDGQQRRRAKYAKLELQGGNVLLRTDRKSKQ
jgi:hypothetical protein